MAIIRRFLEGSLLLRALWNLPVSHAAQYVEVPWSPESYGPDGPWQAVRVTVGGTSEDTDINDEDHKTVDLYPGGIWNSKIITPQACEAHKDGTCGRGGTWDPKTAVSIEMTNNWVDDATGVIANNRGILLQAMTINANSSDKLGFWNQSLVIVDDYTITGPDGRARGPEVGTLGLGAVDQAQIFPTNDPTGPTTPDGKYLGYTFPGAAFNESETQSFSYGLHVGAASLGYNGSLVFGGYDKGRLIAPYTTFDKTLALKDIVIGTETGGSPFDFQGQVGKYLVSGSNSEQESIIVVPEPKAAYFHLPSQTCQQLAKTLPIRFDENIKYWLWDIEQTDVYPKKVSWETVINSPAYLGFVFPPAPGALQDVVIKVPFKLLNLTLDTPIVDKPTPYFPCQPYNPSSDNPYVLGRAFLQAAFVGRNWNRQISWLGQAPGPGKSKEGLGKTLINIKESDVQLSDIFTNTTVSFADTWAGYWTPLEEKEELDYSSMYANKKKLSKGAKAGIGVGVAVLVILIAVVVFLFLRYRRRKQAAQNAAPPEYVESEKYAHMPIEMEQQPPEMSQNVHDWTYELPAEGKTPELGRPMTPNDQCISSPATETDTASPTAVTAQNRNSTTPDTDLSPISPTAQPRNPTTPIETSMSPFSPAQQCDATNLDGMLSPVSPEERRESTTPAPPTTGAR